MSRNLRIKKNIGAKEFALGFEQLTPQPQGTITKYELTILETPLVALDLIATRKYD